jgi:hypothetical protein
MAVIFICACVFSFTLGFMLNAVLDAASKADDELLGDDQYK